MTVSDLAAIGVWLTSVVGGLFAARLITRRPRRAVAAWVRRITRALDQLENNGGSTMRDKIDRLSDNVDQITTVMDGISDVQDLMGEVVDSIRDAQGEMGTKVDVLTERFESHVTLQTEASMASSRAVEAAVAATPPDAA